VEKAAADFLGGSRGLRVGLATMWLLAACGGPPSAPATNAPATVGVQLNSFSVTPSITTVKAGRVTFNITNIATEDAHEFVLINTDLPPDKLPVGGDKMVDEKTLTVVTQLAGIDPGKTGQVIANLSAGQYVLICNRPDHYNQGMHAAFTVAP
jgi:uncharacterized cupredoxin-like copper-binding protein